MVPVQSIQVDIVYGQQVQSLVIIVLSNPPRSTGKPVPQGSSPKHLVLKKAIKSGLKGRFSQCRFPLLVLIFSAEK
jgi:hypothetical protein